MKAIKNLKFVVALSLSTLMLILAVNTEAQTISRIDENGNLLVHEQNFLPFGFYCEALAFDENPMLAQQIAAGGFNYIYAESYIKSPEDIEEYLNEFADFLNDCSSFNVNVVNGLLWQSATPELFSTYVNALKVHPALICWNLMDDANYMELSEVINQRNQLLLLDQSRVTSISFYHIEPPAPYMLPLSEIAYMQSYPWGQYGDNIDLDYSNFMFRNHVLACQNENVLPVATPQTYSWENETYPSPTHIDCQTYLAFITGMKGVIYYTFKDYDNNSTIDITQPEIFAAAAKVAEEVLQTEWQSVILHGTHSYTNIGQYRYYANWLHENALYVMAVNASADDSYHFEIPLPEDAAYEAVNFFDYRPDSLSIENKVLQGELAPYQVAIYKIALSTSTPEITQQLTAQLMPNPADNSFQLSGIDAPTAVSIFNAQGSFVHRQHIARAGERIDIGFLKSGVYFVRFRSIDSGLSQTLKLIKL